MNEQRHILTYIHLGGGGAFGPVGSTSSDWGPNLYTLSDQNLTLGSPHWALILVPASHCKICSGMNRTQPMLYNNFIIICRR
jgi:hypothetical protein